MNNPKTYRVVIVLLFVALCTALVCLVRALSDNFTWKLQVESLAQYEGSTRARHDFQSGRLRLFVISGGRTDDNYSGTNNGPFEVWFPQYFPEVRPFRYAAETMVTAYNYSMQHMHDHPDRYLTSTNITVKKVMP
jgi:hypothetical protein